MNLNEDLKYHGNYYLINYYDVLRTAFEPEGLIQMINFSTWSRMVNYCKYYSQGVVVF